MDEPAVLIAIVGAGLILWGAIPLQWAERRHAAKLKARLDRGEDRYHDELRSLNAYQPRQRRLILFGIGTALLATGVSELLS